MARKIWINFLYIFTVILFGALMIQSTRFYYSHQEIYFGMCVAVDAFCMYQIIEMMVRLLSQLHKLEKHYQKEMKA